MSLISMRSEHMGKFKDKVLTSRILFFLARFSWKSGKGLRELKSLGPCSFPGLSGSRGIGVMSKFGHFLML